MSEIQWMCMKCGRMVEDGEGVVSVSMSEVHQHRTALAEWAATNPGPSFSPGDLASGPARVKWRVTHDVCVQDPEPYDIPVEELRSAWSLVKWTAQLMGKAWLEYTNWADLLREKHAVSGA